MAHDTILLKLVGADEDEGRVQFGDFREFCQAVSSCLKAVERAVGGTSPARYQLAGLHYGSAGIELAVDPRSPGAERGVAAVHLFRDTTHRLQAGMPVDRRIDPEALRKFQRLTAVARYRSKEVWVGGTLLTSQYDANVERILGSTRKGFGSITGKLERINIHHCHECTLFPTPDPATAVKCVFPPDILSKVADALQNKSTVTLTGAIYTSDRSAYPARMTVEDVEVHPRAEELPKLRDLRGAAPAITGKHSIDRFMDDLRNDR